MPVFCGTGAGTRALRSAGRHSTNRTTSDVFPGLIFDKPGAVGGTAGEQTAYLAIAGSHALSGGDILL